MSSAVIDTSILDRYNADHSDDPYLGRIGWYSVHEVDVPFDTVARALADNGLAGYTPKRPADTDLFRRVTKAGEANIAQDDGTVAKVMVRDVAADKDRILRKVVVETVDENNARLSYEEVFDLEYRKKEKRLVTTRLTWHDSPADAAVAGMQSKFQHWTAVSMLDANALRTVVKKALEANNAVLVRPTGGVYFLPRQDCVVLDQVQQFAGTIEQVRLHTLPLVDTPDQVDMVTEGIEAASLGKADELSRDLAAMLRSDASVSEVALARIVTESKRARSRLTGYQELLGTELEGVAGRLDMLDQQVQACLLKMKTEGAA